MHEPKPRQANQSQTKQFSLDLRILPLRRRTIRTTRTEQFWLRKPQNGLPRVKFRGFALGTVGLIILFALTHEPKPRQANQSKTKQFSLDLRILPLRRRTIRTTRTEQFWLRKPQNGLPRVKFRGFALGTVGLIILFALTHEPKPRQANQSKTKQFSLDLRILPLRRRTIRTTRTEQFWLRKHQWPSESKISGGCAGPLQLAEGQDPFSLARGALLEGHQDLRTPTTPSKRKI